MTKYDPYAPRKAAGAVSDADGMIDASGDESPPKTHNLAPDVAVLALIDDLYDEAKNFADGEPILTEEMHDAFTDLDNQLAEAFKVADELRKEEKAPHDKAAKAVQDKYNPQIQKDKGKVDRARKSLRVMMEAYRVRKAKEEAEQARIKREAAAKLLEEAQAAMQESSGNLDAREDAEELAKEAAKLQREANRETKAAGKGMGLKTAYVVEFGRDKRDGMDWAFEKDPAAFEALALTMAQEHATRMKTTTIPGFRVTTEKVL